MEYAIVGTKLHFCSCNFLKDYFAKHTHIERDCRTSRFQCSCEFFAIPVVAVLYWLKVNGNIFLLSYDIPSPLKMGYLHDIKLQGHHDM